MAIFGNSQNALIFEYYLFFRAVFLYRTTLMCCRNVFSMFFCISNFSPKVSILQRLYSLWLVAVFGNFQNALILRILAVYRTNFCIEQLQCVVETFLACFFAFLIFDSK